MNTSQQTEHLGVFNYAAVFTGVQFFAEYSNLQEFSHITYK